MRALTRDLDVRLNRPVQRVERFADHVEIDGEAFTSVAWTDEEVAAADCVVLLTAHREFLEAARWDRAALIVDRASPP